MIQLIDVLSGIIDPANIKTGSASELLLEYTSIIDDVLSQLEHPEFQKGPPRTDIPPADLLPLLEKYREIESTKPDI